MTDQHVHLLQSACEYYLNSNKIMGDYAYTMYLNIVQDKPAKPVPLLPRCTTLMLTYDEWRNRGYQVQSGEKAAWVEGLPLFKRSQVKIQDNTCRIPNPHRTPSNCIGY